MAESSHSTYDVLMAQAFRHFDEGEFEKAGELMERIAGSISRLSPDSLKKRPSLLQLFIMACSRGMQASEKIGRTDRIRRLHAHIQKMMPVDEALFQLLAIRADLALGNLEPARGQLTALAEDRDLPIPVRIDLAHQALRMGWTDLALQILEGTNLPNLPPADDPQRESVEGNLIIYWRMYISALLQAGRLDEVDEPLRKLQEIAPARVPYPMLIAARMRQGDFRRALEYADLIPDLGVRGLLRGVVAAAQGKMDWARDEWWRVVREPLDVEGRRFMPNAWIECALRLGDLEKYESGMRMLAEIGRTIEWVPLYQALYQARQGQLSEGLATFREALKAQLEWSDTPAARDTLTFFLAGLIEQVLGEGQGRREFLAAMDEIVAEASALPSVQEE